MHVGRAPIADWSNIDHMLQPVYYALLGFHVFGLGFLTSMVSV